MLGNLFGGGRGRGGGGGGGGRRRGGGGGGDGEDTSKQTPQTAAEQAPTNVLEDKELQQQFSGFKASGVLEDKSGLETGFGPIAKPGGGGGKNIEDIQYPKDYSGREKALYQKLKTEFTAHPPQATSDMGTFGIKKGTADEYAAMGVATARAESSLDPKTKNLSDPGGSYGIFQYAHGQVPGKDAYNVDASVKAYVRDVNAAASQGSLRLADKGKGYGRGGQYSILGGRFATIGAHPERTEQYIAGIKSRQAGTDVTDDRGVVDKTSVKTVKVNANGAVKVDVSGDATLNSSKGLFKPTPVERPTQMQPAETGPKETKPAKSESHTEEAGPG